MFLDSACGVEIRIQGKKPFNSEQNLFAAIVQLTSSVWLLSMLHNAPQCKPNVVSADTELLDNNER